MNTKELTNNIYGVVYRTADPTLLHNNANKASERIPVMRDFVSGEVSKYLASQDETLIPTDVYEAHKHGDIHWHDLDYSPLFPMVNCCLVDLRGMLENGFKMGGAEIETPKSITTATAITAQIVAQVASHIYGGTSLNRIDEVLAPYVTMSYNKHLADAKIWNIQNSKKYAVEKTEKEVYDAFQGLEYEINTIHTANGQTPFVTLGLGLGTSWESKLIQVSILKVRMHGLGKHHRTAIFPKLTFCIKEGVNRSKSDPNYDVKQLMLKCMSKRIYPDILNYDEIVRVTGGFKAPMGCRSFLSEYTDPESGEKVYDGRNNMGVISLNLPAIAMQTNDVDEFMQLLNERMELAHRGLQARIERMRGVTADTAPILYMEGAFGKRLKAKDKVIQLFENGRATVSLGYIGVHEMCEILFPDEHHIYESKVKQDFAIKVLKCMHDACAEWKSESGWAYSLYATPSESLCDRFCRIDSDRFDHKKYGHILDKGYYTNSFHLDVHKKTSPNGKIDFEQVYPQYSTGGNIVYCELPDMRNFLDALEWVVDYSYDKVPYFGTNIPINYCGECGHAGEVEATEKGFACPECGNHDPETLQVVIRVCGYLGNPGARPFIEGKQKEVMRRITHTGD